MRDETRRLGWGLGAGALAAFVFIGAPGDDSTTIETIDDLREADESGKFFATTDGQRLSTTDAAARVQNGESVIAVDDPYEEDPLTSTYYHAATTAEDLDIRDAGIFPTEAAECPSGVGVHVTETQAGAEAWADRLSAERSDVAADEWDIYEVRVPESVEVVEDVFAGVGEADALVACTDFGIPPRFVTLSKRL